MMWRVSSNRFVSFLLSNNFHSRSLCLQIEDNEVIKDDPDIFGTLQECPTNDLAKGNIFQKSDFKVHFKETYPSKININLKNEPEFGSYFPNDTKVPLENLKSPEDYHHATFHTSRFTAQAYGQKMLKLCNQKKLTEALEIFEKEMKEVRCKPDLFCYNVLINACGKAGYSDKAFSLYLELRKHGLRPDKFTYTGLFNSCANSPWPTKDGLERCRKLKAQLSEKGVVLSPINYHAMIKAFGRGGDIKTAFAIVDEMLANGHTVTTETFNFLFQACLSDRPSGFRHALTTWDKLKKSKLKPDLFSYHLFLRCTKQCNVGESDVALEVAYPFINKAPTKKLERKMPILDIDLNILSHEKDKIQNIENSSLNQTQNIENSSLNKTQNIENSSLNSDQTGDECNKEPKIIQADHHQGLGRRSTTNDASSLSKDEMPEFWHESNNQNPSSHIGTQIPIDSYSSPVKRLVAVGGITELFQNMKRYRIRPNITTFTLILDSLPNNIKMEMELLSMMLENGVKPDIIFCNTLISRRCRRSKLSQAKAILDLLQDYSLLPDIVTFGCLAIGCVSEKDIRFFLVSMSRAGMRPNETILETLINNALKNELYKVGLDLLFDSIKSYDVEASEKMIQFHEKARLDVRAKLLEDERNPGAKLTAEKKKEMEVYLKYYSVYLKRYKIQLDQHPWKQYGFDTKKAQFIKTS